jgi:hypothetical protein
MANHHETGAAVRLPPVLACIMGVPVAPREAVELTIQAAIGALDDMDGDPDEDEDDAEDAFGFSRYARRWINDGPRLPGR